MLLAWWGLYPNGGREKGEVVEGWNPYSDTIGGKFFKQMDGNMG